MNHQQVCNVVNYLAQFTPASEFGKTVTDAIAELKATALPDHPLKRDAYIARFVRAKRRAIEAIAGYSPDTAPSWLLVKTDSPEMAA